MNERELLVSRWLLDGAAALHLPPYFFKVTAKPLKKAAMTVTIDPQYLHVEVQVDIRATFSKGSYLSRLYLAHELTHVLFHVIGASFEEGKEESACDWVGTAIVPRMPDPPDELVAIANGLMP